MELTKTPEGNVSRLALVRAIRDQTHQAVGRQVGVTHNVVYEWERYDMVPSTAMAKRLAMALGWKWQDLLLPSLPYEDAWTMLLDARKRQASLRTGT